MRLILRPPLSSLRGSDCCASALPRDSLLLPLVLEGAKMLSLEWSVAWINWQPLLTYFWTRVGLSWSESRLECLLYEMLLSFSDLRSSVVPWVLCEDIRCSSQSWVSFCGQIASCQLVLQARLLCPHMARWKIPSLDAQVRYPLLSTPSLWLH